MGQTTVAVTPFVLLNRLRNAAPQFAEQDPRGGFSQQGGFPESLMITLDADEAWTQIISALRASLPGSSHDRSFVDEYMSIRLIKR